MVAALNSEMQQVKEYGIKFVIDEERSEIEKNEKIDNEFKET